MDQKHILNSEISCWLLIYLCKKYICSSYLDATEEELRSGDNVCIICREEMLQGCKKLPCNHIFHTNCLRSWFQRQQTCPTCRMDVLRPTVRPQTTTPQQQQNQQQQQQNNPGEKVAACVWELYKVQV